jgi:hypothetical protein
VLIKIELLILSCGEIFALEHLSCVSIMVRTDVVRRLKNGIDAGIGAEIDGK